MQSDKINIIVVGTSGHSNVALDIIEENEKFKLLGFIDDFRTEPKEDYPILGKIEDLREIIKKYPNSYFFIAIGDNWNREIVFKKMIELDSTIKFVNLISEKANISKKVKIGMGNIILPGVTINRNCNIGDFTILNTNSTLDHDSEMGDFSSLAPGVHTGGNVKIGKNTAVGIGATILQNITIGENSIIGAGSLVNKNIEQDSVYYGSPAKFVRKIDERENYL